ncbi:MAG: hypothetical protein HZB53_12195 [Chloroflexi bacterium]|nr:hypothetical protein [Chloroflexota bacterium]
MARKPLFAMVGLGVLLLVVFYVQVIARNIAAPAILSATPTPTVAAVFSNVPATCPITRPPNPAFVPPAPWPAEPVGGDFWIGTPELWTSVSSTGMWIRLPHNPTGYSQKIPVWKPNYSAQLEPQPKLTITGKRLDVAAPSYVTSGGTNACHSDFGGCVMMWGVDLPSLGCWKLTIEHASYELSFVVWVAQ